MKAIEKAAKALAKSQYGEDDWDGISEPSKALILKDVRAAIAAWIDGLTDEEIDDAVTKTVNCWTAPGNPDGYQMEFDYGECRTALKGTLLDE